MWQDVPAKRIEVGDKILVAPGEEREVVAIRKYEGKGEENPHVRMPPESKGEVLSLRHAPVGKHTGTSKTESYLVGSEDLVATWLC